MLVPKTPAFPAPLLTRPALHRLTAADAAPPALSAADAEVQSRIEALGEERKALLADGVRDKHFNWGSLLLALGVAIAIEGPVNTYLRTGKLFPGPHLYAGAGIVVLWAAAAACVPQMQKGNDTARSVHIGLNAANMLLFAWQVSGVRLCAESKGQGSLWQHVLRADAACLLLVRLRAQVPTGLEIVGKVFQFTHWP